MLIKSGKIYDLSYDNNKNNNNNNYNNNNNEIMSIYVSFAL